MGPENRFIHRVHKHLPSKIYREKMHNPYRGGTPDVWYSGGRDCWIEYKWSAKRSGLLIPDLSPLQTKWISDRTSEGRLVFVVVGSPTGAAWIHNLPTGDDGTRYTDKEVAELITLACADLSKEVAVWGK